MALRTLSLCSGVGGLDLGVRLAVPGARTVCYVEREAFCAATLVARMEEASLDLAPVWDDLKTFDGRPWRGVVDLVSGGYPCQPFSLAGARKGSDDPRHLWPDVRRIVGEVGPRLCFFENVSGHLSLGFEEVVADLEGMDYRVAAGLFTAEEVGAPHRRERLFIMAHSDRSGLRDESRRSGRASGSGEGVAEHDGSALAHSDDERRDGLNPLLLVRRPRQDSAEAAERGAEVGDSTGRSTTGDSEQGGSRHPTGESGGQLGYADDARLEGRDGPVGGSAHEWTTWPPSPSADWSGIPEEAQPAVRGVADGAALRVDRLRALGNGVVPAQACLAFRTLAGVLLD